MYRKTIVSALASGALVLSACAGTDSAEPSNGVASLDTVAAAPVDGEDALDAAPQESGEGDAPEDGASSDGDTELTEDDIDKAYADYDKCLEEIGLGDLVSASEGGVETDVVAESSGDGVAIEGDPAELEEQFERMQDECDPIIAEVNQGFELSPEQEAAQADAELAFARCMREAGFDFPDPGASGDLGQVIEFDGEDFDIDALDEATDECDSAFESLNELFEEEG